ITDFAHGIVRVLDANNAIVASLQVCAIPGGIAVNGPAKRAYVACRDSVAFIDGNGPGGSFRVVGHLPVPVFAATAYADPGASLVFAANGLLVSGTSGPVGTPGINIIRDANGALDGELTVASVQSPTANGGTATIGSNGIVHYVPPSDFSGTDTFTYTATDGQA